MKKIIAFLMAVIMSLSLVACAGGIDRQPAIDAFNKASTAFDEFADVINENPDAYDEEIINGMVELANVMIQHKEMLEGEEEIAEETLAEMITWYGTVEQWVAEAKTELGIE